MLGDELRDSALAAANSFKKNNKFVTIVIPTKQDDYVKFESVDAVKTVEPLNVEASLPSKRIKKKRKSLSRKSIK